MTSRNIGVVQLGSLIVKDAQRFGPSPCHSCHPSCFENETVLTTLMVTAEYECVYFVHICACRLAGLLSRKNPSQFFPSSASIFTRITKYSLISWMLNMKKIVGNNYGIYLPKFIIENERVVKTPSYLTFFSIFSVINYTIFSSLGIDIF